jgi:hypothetical protein
VGAFAGGLAAEAPTRHGGSGGANGTGSAGTRAAAGGVGTASAAGGGLGALLVASSEDSGGLAGGVL